MNENKINSPWVLVEINSVLYAISCNTVLSLNQIPEITPLPVSPPEIRGIINFRAKSIELIDTRVLLNLKSITQDVKYFEDIMLQRYNDHLNWINNLDKSVQDNVKFSLTTNPHECAFGKWYDKYKPKNANIMFLSTFAKFDKPHKAIHQTAIVVQNLIEKGKHEEAVKLIQSTKNNELQEMLRLFEDIKQAYRDSRKEIVVVIGTENHCLGLSVDQVSAIEFLFEFDEHLINDSLTNNDYLSGIAKRKNGSAVFLVNDEYILNKYK